jgi:hypothetical protein
MVRIGWSAGTPRAAVTSENASAASMRTVDRPRAERATAS